MRTRRRHSRDNSGNSSTTVVLINAVAYRRRTYARELAEAPGIRISALMSYD